MNVTGSWQGEYLFDEDACDKEAAQVVGHIVGFTLELHQGWLGALSGTVQDDVRTGFTEQGTLRGKFKGRMIDFRVGHPVFRLMYESSRITLEKWAERRKVVVDSDRASPAMLFEAELKTGEGGIETFEGTWRMSGETLMIPGSYQALIIPTIGGTWRMRRKA